jgi:uncharacterized NAD(P)/FAD-binding protein YdhS
MEAFLNKILMQRPSIVIIGGGFCGLMTAYNLVKSSPTPLNITLINAGYTTAKGIAYGAGCDKFLLNVPAGKMTALPQQPDHFLNWLHQRHPFSLLDKDVLSRMFVPRMQYGIYLEELLKDINQNSASHQFNTITEYAEDIVDKEVILSSGKKITADFIVLATGNESPQNPPLRDDTFYKSGSYFNNPWNEDSFQTIDPSRNVLIVGNGLTMVDTVLGLHEYDCSGTIYSLSPNGFTILPHRHGGLIYTQLLEELKEPVTINQLFTLFHKHIRILRQFGLSAEPVVDSIRPLSQEIWKKLSAEERKRFLTHLRHLWGVARHRLPLHIYDFVQNLRIQNKLIVLKGKLVSINENNDNITVTYYDRKLHEEKSITVGRVINCTGPSLDISQSKSTLLRNLFEKGMIRPDELRLGIDTDQDGNVIGSDNRVNKDIFTLGGNLRGLLWESTAIPELRVQAKNLASLLSERLSDNAL